MSDPDPQVPERASRRTYPARYKLAILTEYDALDAIVTYDHRLTEGAHLLGIRTLAPGSGG